MGMCPAEVSTKAKELVKINAPLDIVKARTFDLVQNPNPLAFPAAGDTTHPLHFLAWQALLLPPVLRPMPEIPLVVISHLSPHSSPSAPRGWYH